MRSVPLENVCLIEMGQAPKGSSYNNDGIGFPLLAGAGDFGADKPKPSKFTTSPTKLSKPDDILLCIRATVGDLNWSDKEYCLGRGVAGLRPKNGALDRNYLWRWLETHRTDLEKKARGSTFKQVSRRDIAELAIDLPRTVEDQQRIAAILDKADGIRRKRELLNASINEMLRATFLETFGDPRKVTESDLTLNDVAHVARGRFSPRPRNDPRFYDGAHPFIQTGEIANSDGYMSNFRQTLNDEGTKVSKSFPVGTVYIAIVGATIGATAISTREFWCPDSVIGIVPKNSDYPAEFLEYLLRFWRPVFVDRAPETARANINLQTLKPVPIPMCNNGEAKRFGRLYQKLHDLKNNLKRLDDDLFASLSQRAFRGEL